MIRRIAMVGAIIVAFALPSFWQTDSILFAAPANGVDDLFFAHGVSRSGDAIGRSIEFGKDSSEVWAIFDFSNVPPHPRMSFLLRVNHEDYSWGDLNCCDGAQAGRFAFQLPRRSGRHADLPGGAYRLFIYEGGNEVAQAGFGVKGRKGLDNGNTNSNH